MKKLMVGLCVLCMLCVVLGSISTKYYVDERDNKFHEMKIEYCV